MPSKRIIFILLTILVLVCQNRLKTQLLQRWFGLMLSQGAATEPPPWVITGAGQLVGHTWYHLVVAISVLLVAHQIYAAEVKRKKRTVISFRI